jgi:hypothetical protein
VDLPPSKNNPKTPDEMGKPPAGKKPSLPPVSDEKGKVKDLKKNAGATPAGGKGTGKKGGKDDTGAPTVAETDEVTSCHFVAIILLKEYTG